MVRTEKMLLKMTDEIECWINDATAIYNQALFYFRQEYFQARDEKRKPDYSKIDLYKLVKETDAWKDSDLDINVKQQTLRKVNDNWKSFYKSLKSYWKNKSKFKGIPKLPKYLKDGRSTVLIVDKSRLKKKDFENNTLCLPKSKNVLMIPNHIKIGKIRCIVVKRHYGKAKYGICYEKEMENEKVTVNYENHIGIDIGVENIAAITTDNHVGKSWIVKGGAIRSINQFYNKRLAEMKSVLEKVNGRKTSKAIQKLSLKRENKLDYEFHCISRKIINLCIENNIGTIVIGHNNGWKQNANIGKINNQKFVQIPFNSLIHKIQYKAEECGLDVVITEESYTSKVDHLVGESMEKHEEYLGRRVKRGLFRSSCGKLVNADVNGSIGMLRKANALSDADLDGLRDRGDVVSPLVLKYKP